MLFKDSITLKKYAQISGTVDFSAFVASLRMVEQKYIIPTISKEIYDALIDAINAATEQDPLAEVWENLLHQCRMAAGPLLCYFHADKADVKFSDAGMQRSETATNKNAYQEQRTKFKEANLSEGEFALELLQQFLEENNEDYPEWVDSENFKKYKSLFIKTGKEFDETFPSQTPYRNYWMLRSKMFDLEENNIKKYLGKNFYNKLKEEDAKENPDFSEEEHILLQKLKKAIAYITVSLAVPFLNVRFGSNGLTVPAVATFSSNDNENSRSGIDDKMINSFINSCSNTGKDWMNNVDEYIKENPTAFPTWIGFEIPVTNVSSDCPKKEYNNIFSL